MTSFIKSHGQTDVLSGGFSVASSLTSTVSAGRTLVVTAQAGGTFPGAASSPTLTKPEGEAATWTQVIERNATTADGDTRSHVSVWVIVTTVAWNSGTTITATWGFSNSVRSLSVVEYEGVSTEIIGSALASDNELGDDTISVDTGAIFSAGDLAVKAAVVVAMNPLISVSEADGGTATASSNTISSTISGQSDITAYARGFLITGAGNRTATLTRSGYAKSLVIVGLRALNYPPNAPTLTSMADGGTVNRGITQRASHLFSDPVPSDAQSKFDLRYRLIGAGSWTTVTQTTPNQFYDFPAGSLAAGDYERQVRTYDSVGVVGPYSTSGFFTAADAPDGPTITDPVNGETIILPTNAFTWSAPDQDAYQVRKVADDTLSPGTPDTAVVYYDSGEVADTTTRTVQLDFPVNGRTEHLQVRVKFDDLWSDWASIVVDVDYTEPPVPSFEISADIATGSLLVSITNPDPAEGDPAASYNDVYVDDGNGEERRATAVPPNTSWRYWLPVSGRDYSTAIRVVAVAASGATASSV